MGPQLTPYDTHDLGGLLRPGKNVVALFAYHYGCYNAFSVNQRAGLWAELALTAAVGSPAGETIIGTDAGWRVRPFAGYRRDRQGRLALCVLNASLDPVAQARLLVSEEHAYRLLRADGEEQDVQLVGRDGEYDVLGDAGSYLDLGFRVDGLGWMREHLSHAETVASAISGSARKRGCWAYGCTRRTMATSSGRQRMGSRWNMCSPSWRHILRFRRMICAFMADGWG